MSDKKKKKKEKSNSSKQRNRSDIAKVKTQAREPNGFFKTSYDPIYCQKIIEFAQQDGRSFTSFCTEIGIARSTGFLWIETYPEFAQAKKEFDQIAYSKLEKLAFAQATGYNKGNSRVLLFILNGKRFKELDCLQQVQQTKEAESDDLSNLTLAYSLD